MYPPSLAHHRQLHPLCRMTPPPTNHRTTPPVSPSPTMVLFLFVFFFSDLVVAVYVGTVCGFIFFFQISVGEEMVHHVDNEPPHRWPCLHQQ
ncbi:hypothetical protein AAZX31_19G207500 [Glycine max]